VNGGYVCSMRARLIAAFAAVYLVWGSTYLAIRFAVETLPPLLMAGARFLIAGAIILGWARLRAPETRPTRADWRIGMVTGCLLLLGGNGLVVWAEQRVSSGLTALLVAIVPVWMVVLDWMRPGGRRPRAFVFVGLALGLGGLALLMGPGASTGHDGANIAGAIALIIASLSWAAGSLYAQHGARPSSGMNAVGTQMVAGGAQLVIAGVLLGELAHIDIGHATTRSLLAFLYLVTVGSLVGYTAYMYLLAHTTAAKASTYAYVNPVVAVFLGWAIAHETVTQRTVIAAAVILAGVAIITIARDPHAPPHAPPAPRPSDARA
jgi:drug/metabolite transporter (DMT)-like permease